MKLVGEACTGKGCAPLDRLTGSLKDLDALASRISTTLMADPAAQIGRGPVIAEGVDAEQITALREENRKHGKQE